MVVSLLTAGAAPAIYNLRFINYFNSTLSYGTDFGQSSRAGPEQAGRDGKGRGRAATLRDDRGRRLYRRPCVDALPHGAGAQARRARLFAGPRPARSGRAPPHIPSFTIA